MSFGLSKDGLSYCANSDLFYHGLRCERRDLSDETYKRQAKFFEEPLVLDDENNKNKEAKK